MKRILILNFALLLSISAISKTEVRGLVLKFTLVDLCFEMYQVNVISQQSHSAERYEKKNCLEHYNWLRDTYNKLSKSQKQDLKYIFTTYRAWHIMQGTAQLEDTADFDIVLKQIINSKSGSKYKSACKRFFPFIYKSYIKDYIATNERIYKERALSLNEKLSKDTFDIFEFMERESGIKFPVKRKAVFYYSMRPIGAMAFTTGTDKISLIQTNIDRYEGLFDTPFHEFSHELFKTFTRSDEFKDLSNRLMSDSLLLIRWESGTNHSYNWTGWCEENLVEGFANYLFSKFTKRQSNGKIYIYDRDFYLYLTEVNFNPLVISLKQASFDFYTKIINKNSPASN